MFFAFVVHTTKGYNLWITELSLLYKSGLITRSFNLDSSPYLYTDICGLVYFEENKFVIINDDRAVQVRITGATIKKTPNYRVYLETNPAYSFSSSDITIDHHSHILLVIPNDNAIHLLDSPWPFRIFWWRNRMVSTDQHQWHWTLRNSRMWDEMDRFMSWIILNTNRLKRLKIEKSQF